MTQEEVRDALKAAMNLPSGTAICRNAMNAVLGSRPNTPQQVKASFSAIIDEITTTAQDMYFAAQHPAIRGAIRDVFGGLLQQGASAEDLFQLLDENVEALDRFFLSVAQGRRIRPGNGLDQIIRELFTGLGYPYTPQAVINGQPDFLLPSAEHYQQNAMDCIVFTVKRTLRERWRQITTEGTRGTQFFLGTIDPKISPADLPQMLQARIYVVTTESIRAAKYPGVTNVLSFETFFAQHLDPAMARWRANGVIP